MSLTTQAGKALRSLSPSDLEAAKKLARSKIDMIGHLVDVCLQTRRLASGEVVFVHQVPIRERIKMAELLLAYAYGRPRQAVEIDEGINVYLQRIDNALVMALNGSATGSDNGPEE